MRALAELIMKGRTQAVIVAALSVGSVLFSWIGASAVALVTLRKGAYQGGMVLLWALLPATAVAYWGDTGPLSMLIGAAAAAAVLRSIMSWPWALVIASAVGLLTSLALVSLGHGILDRVLVLMNEMLQQLAPVQQGEVAVGDVLPTATEFAGLLGLNNAFVVAGCLMLARWWQAMLYNPGGFGEEMRAVRIPPALTVVLIAVGVAVAALGAEYIYWAATLAMPLVIAGFSLVHATARARNISTGWLVLFYIAWLLLGPLKTGLLVIAVADSWMNFRARLNSGRSAD